MKRKILALLAVILLLQTPVQAADTGETPPPAESTIDLKTSVFIDYSYLMSLYAHPPKIEMLTEKTKEAYYCAKAGDYEKAVELFDSYIAEFAEIAEFHEADYALYSERISEQAAIMGEVYDFYCKVAMKYCSMALTSLSYYINCSQSPEEEGCLEAHESEYLGHIETAQFAMSLVNYAARYVTLSFIKGMINPSDDPETVYGIISETFITPYDEDVYDWYNESYLVFKDNAEETEFDINDIPAAIVKGSEPAQEQDSIKYGEGMYKVGSDIPEGEYIVLRNEDEKYYASICVSADSNKDDILTYHSVYTHHYVTVNKGQYFELSGCTAVSAEANPLVIESTENIPEGTYKVGTDIPAGEYKLTADPDEYYSSSSIYAGSEAESKLLSYNSVKTTSYVTVKDGQYLVLSHCTATLVD